MVNEKYLLNNQDMSQFIANGYLLLKPDYPAGLHQTIKKRTEYIFKSGDPGNQILEQVPELYEIFDHPVVKGTLQSIIGLNYIMQPHRHCHVNMPDSKGQGWHQDGTPRKFQGWNHPWRRHQRSRMAMAFYYPQDVSTEMGPTAILPGTQYYDALNDTESMPSLPICGEAGTIAIVHYEIWHRASANLSSDKRYMMKFLFHRTEEPKEPSWNLDVGSADLWNKIGSTSDIDIAHHPILWESLWNWYSNQNDDSTLSQLDTLDVHQLVQELDQKTEVAERMEATYKLGTIGEAAITPIMDQLNNGIPEQNSLNLSAALSAIGEPAVPVLIDMLRHDSDWWKRACAADTLGDIGKDAKDSVQSLIEALDDESDWVRRNATNSLGIISESLGDTISALIRAMEDAQPFVPINAIFALTKIRKSHPNYDPLFKDVELALNDALNHQHERVSYYSNYALEQFNQTQNQFIQ